MKLTLIVSCDTPAHPYQPADPEAVRRMHEEEDREEERGDRLIANIAYALDQAQGSVGGSELGCFVEELMKLMTRQQAKEFETALLGRVECGMKPFN